MLWLLDYQWAFIVKAFVVGVSRLPGWLGSKGQRLCLCLNWLLLLLFLQLADLVLKAESVEFPLLL